MALDTSVGACVSTKKDLRHEGNTKEKAGRGRGTERLITDSRDLKEDVVGRISSP